MFKKYLLPVLFTFFCYQHQVSADEIIVSANRIPTPYSQITSSLKLITSSDIDAYQVTTLPELLRKVSGMNVVSNGGVGKVTSLFLRGTDSRHTLILIDGVEVSDTTSIGGSPRLEFISLKDVERIEIIKGSQGVLYGSAAIGGVIKITTKNGLKGTQTNFGIGYGSYKNKTFDFNHFKQFKKLTFKISAAFQEIDGFSSYNEDKIVTAENDPFDSLTLAPSLHLNLGKHSLEFRGRFNKSKTEFDKTSGDSEDFEEYSQSSYGLVHKAKFESVDIEHEFQYSETNTTRDLLSSGSHLPYEAKLRKAGLTEILKLGKKVSTLIGFDAQDETAKSLGSLLPKKVKNESYGAYSFTNLGNRNLFFDFGARVQKYKFFGESFTYKAGAGTNIGKFFAKASFSTGFKAPSLYQSHGPFVGNTELVSEESESFDLSTGIRGSSFSAEVNVFSIHYDNFIDYDLGTSRYINDDDISIKGVELSVEKTFFNKFQLMSEFTIMRAKDKRTGEYLVRRPKEKGRLEVSYVGHDDLNLSLEGEYVGRRNDTSQVLPGYVLANFRTSYSISSEENIYFKLDNLLNKDYEEALNFGTAGRSFQLGYKVSI